MMETKNNFQVWHYAIGLMSTVILLLVVNNNYEGYIRREYSRGTKIKAFKLLIQKLDSIGRPNFRICFFRLNCFVFHLQNNIRCAQ